MKCLLITSIFPPIHGGSAVVYENICRYAPAGSVQVLAPWRHYATMEVLEDWEVYDTRAPYKVHRLELLRPPMVVAKSKLHSLWLFLTTDIPLKLRVLWSTTRIIRREGIDVVCIGELSSGSWLGVFCQRWLGCRMINYIHGEEITTETSSRSFQRNRSRYLRQADGVVAVSNFTRQALIDLMRVDPEKIELITNGVDLNRFHPEPKSESLLQRYGLAGKQVLLTVGRLIPRKGFDMVLKALPQILEHCPDAHYLIVGEGPYRRDLERLVEEGNLKDHVTFSGRISEEELNAHYCLCDLFLMPNRELSDHDTEGFGLVFLEANACGKAVIGGRAGGVVEAVRDGENGLLVEGNDEQAIATITIRLLSNVELREKIETRGLGIARAASSKHNVLQFIEFCG